MRQRRGRFHGDDDEKLIGLQREADRGQQPRHHRLPRRHRDPVHALAEHHQIGQGEEDQDVLALPDAGPGVNRCGVQQHDREPQRKGSLESRIGAAHQDGAPPDVAGRQCRQAELHDGLRRCMERATKRDGNGRDPEDERRVFLDDIPDIDAGAIQETARGVEVPGLIAPDRLHEEAGHRHPHHRSEEKRQQDRHHRDL